MAKRKTLLIKGFLFAALVLAPVAAFAAGDGGHAIQHRGRHTGGIQCGNAYPVGDGPAQPGITGDASGTTPAATGREQQQREQVRQDGRDDLHRVSPCCTSMI